MTLPARPNGGGPIREKPPVSARATSTVEVPAVVASRRRLSTGVRMPATVLYADLVIRFNQITVDSRSHSLLGGEQGQLDLVASFCIT